MQHHCEWGLLHTNRPIEDHVTKADEPSAHTVRYRDAKEDPTWITIAIVACMAAQALQ